MVLPFPSSGDLINPEVELGSPTLQADFLLFELPGKLISLSTRVSRSPQWHKLEMKHETDIKLDHFNPLFKGIQTQPLLNNTHETRYRILWWKMDKWSCKEFLTALGLLILGERMLPILVFASYWLWAKNNKKTKTKTRNKIPKTQLPFHILTALK